MSKAGRSISVLLLSGLLLACNPAVDADSGNKNDLFFPNLLEQLDEVNKITVSTVGLETPVNILRTGDNWRLESPAGVPANPNLIKDLIRKIAIAKNLEIKTSRTAWHQYLGVSDIQSGKATGPLIKLQTDNSSWQLIIGNSSVEQKGQYWRQAEQAVVVRVDQTLELPAQLLDWMDRLIIDVPAEAVAAIVVSNASGQSFHLRREEEYQDLVLSSNSLVESPVQMLVQGLYKLHYAAIRRADGLQQPAEYQLEYLLFDGNSITMSCTPDNDGSWCQLVVKAATESHDHQTLQQHADSMNMSLSPWSFHLSPKRTELFSRALKSLEENESDDS